MLPTSVVKGKGFCDLIAFLQGTEELYSEAAASLREILPLAEKVALTTDADSVDYRVVCDRDCSLFSLTGLHRV